VTGASGWRAALLAPALILAGCANSIVPKTVAAPPVAARPVLPVPPSGAPAPAAASALALSRQPGPSLAGLGLDVDQAETALGAFKLSCPELQRRADRSGLTVPADWTASCAAAATWPQGRALAFFSSYFETVQFGDGKALATGYFEPEIAGSRERRPGYDVAVYRRPSDLIQIDLGEFSSQFAGKSIRGRMVDGAFRPYFDRAAIVDGALAGRGLEIAWARDPIEFFFLQIQGSGRLRLPDGSIMRIGYDGQNGHDYTGIGRLLLDRGELAPGGASMQSIVGWLRANPERAPAVMNENRSYVFFRELTGPGPVGAMGLAVTPGASVAVDPAYIPLGAPVLLTLDRPEAKGIWIAQDTGGAIKGANRVDTFWGAGAEAARIAGGMSARGPAWLLLPRQTLARLDGAATAKR